MARFAANHGQAAGASPAWPTSEPRSISYGVTMTAEATEFPLDHDLLLPIVGDYRKQFIPKEEKND
jgi:hypothetical protein